MAMSFTVVSQLIFLTILLSPAAIYAAGDDHNFGRILDRKLIGLEKEKLIHFKMYWHDIYSGPNPTAMVIVRPNNTSPTGFGMISMIDDALTEGPDRNSKLLGRAQGFYAWASQADLGFLMAMNFVFIEGKYNGSTITIMGRNKAFIKVKEMPVIGGSGLFRFARGYVQFSTYSYDQKSGDAVVEYNIYVLHY